jgi:hypothetical protein
LARWDFSMISYHFIDEVLEHVTSWSVSVTTKHVGFALTYCTKSGPYLLSVFCGFLATQFRVQTKQDVFSLFRLYLGHEDADTFKTYLYARNTDGLKGFLDNESKTRGQFLYKNIHEGKVSNTPFKN